MLKGEESSLYYLIERKLRMIVHAIMNFARFSLSVYYLKIKLEIILILQCLIGTLLHYQETSI